MLGITGGVKITKYDKYSKCDSSVRILIILLLVWNFSYNLWDRNLLTLNIKYSQYFFSLKWDLKTIKTDWYTDCINKAWSNIFDKFLRTNQLFVWQNSGLRVLRIISTTRKQSYYEFNHRVEIFTYMNNVI